MALFRSHEQVLRELRESPRFDVHYPAYIERPDGSLRNCIICDISASGARLTVGSQGDVPGEFTLLLRRRCRVVRREDGQVGVHFLYTS
jgi:hypothetical protein